MMIMIELKSPKEFESITTMTDEELLEMLKSKYPKTFSASVDEVNELLLETWCTKVPEEKLLDAVSMDDFLDVFEDLYFEEVGWESDEIIENYFVKDKIGTDFGVWEMVVENGYVLLV